MRNNRNKRESMLKIVALGLCVIFGILLLSPWKSQAAEDVERVYHYVGHEDASSVAEFFTIFNFNPNVDTTVRIEVIDHRGVSRFVYDVPRASHMVLREYHMGITDLYYMRIRSNRKVAVSVTESYVSSEVEEFGSVTPQEKLYSSYALANGSGNAHDDFFRIYAPVTPTTIKFYDQNMNLVATRTIDGNGLAEFKASDLGYSSFWSAYIKSENGARNPFAISFLEGPEIAFLSIPQGIR